MTGRWHWERALLLALPLALGACGSGMDDLEERIAAVKAEPGPKPEEYPKPKPYTPYAYVPADRRDPFAPFTGTTSTATGEGGIRPDLARNREPLEEFTLDSLKMVGTLAMYGKNYALIKAPDGVVHRVTIGDHLGRDYGEITAITETEVSITEIVPTGLNTWTQRPATLALVQ
jgi:type IV pilus assembly protein PilP